MKLLLLSSVLLVITTVVIFRWILKYFRLRKLLKPIPSLEDFPLIGITWKFLWISREDRYQWFNAMCLKFNNGMVVTWFGTEPVVTIRKPRQLEVILPSNTNITKGRSYDIIKPWLGDGLVTSTGDVWFNHRRLITPAFHFGVLEEYAVVMREKVEIFNECIMAKVQNNPKAPINIFELAIKYTLDTICETAMGINMDTQRKPDSEYVKALHTFARLAAERFWRFWLKWDAIYYRTQEGKESSNAVKTMHDFTEKVIKEKQANRRIKNLDNNEDEFDEFGKRKRKAFLDLLLDANENSNNPLTFQEIREEVDTFMFAGHDTTSAAISWSLFILGNNPEIQSKIREEFKDIFGDGNETATIKQLGQLKYLDRVVKESLRLYPSAPSVNRRLDNDVMIDGCLIPKGTIVAMSIHQLHHDPEIWENPEKFDPDRFLPENSQGRHPYSYIPFSAGPRNCVGQKFALLEIKTALTSILRRWSVLSVLKPSEIKSVLNFILRPHNEKIELYFTPIKST